jgi:hypothetical protein
VLESNILAGDSCDAMVLILGVAALNPASVFRNLRNSRLECVYIWRNRPSPRYLAERRDVTDARENVDSMAGKPDARP